MRLREAGRGEDPEPQVAQAPGKLQRAGAETISVERLDRVNEPRVQRPAPLLQQAAVRDLMRERMLERVLEIRKQPGLVEELGGLQAIEPATERLVREIGDRLEQCERD